MYMPIIFLFIIYSILIIYVYLKYNWDAKPNEYYDIYREKLYVKGENGENIEILASEAAFLTNKDINNMDLILADILTLVNKGYIKIDILKSEKITKYVFETTQKKDFTKLKNHEMMSYNLFFENGKQRVDLKEYIESIKVKEELERLQIKDVTIKSSLDMEYKKLNIIDPLAEKELFKYNKLSITLIIIAVLTVIVGAISLKSNYLFFGLSNLLLSLLFYRSTMQREDKITIIGANLKEQIRGLKKYINQYVIVEDKPLYAVNILEYNYIMAIAFGFAKLGKNEFIHKLCYYYIINYNIR